MLASTRCRVRGFLSSRMSFATSPRIVNRLLTSPPYFADSFESGDTSAWSAEDGTVTVDGASALIGSYGASVALDANNSVRKDYASGYEFVAVRFYIDPDGASMSNGETSRVILPRSSGWDYVGHIEFQYASGNYRIKGTIAGDISNTDTSWYVITDESHFVEVHWTIASGVGANNGELKLYIDGVLKETLPSIDNDTFDIGKIDMGSRDRFSGSSTDPFLLDAFVASDRYIGPA